MSSSIPKINFNTSKGSKYIIDISLFDANPLQKEIEVYDLVLQQIENKGDQNYEVLNFLAFEVLKFLDNNNGIIYFYCDKNDIRKNKRNSHYSNQAYRNKLFNALFERIKQKSKREGQAFNYLLRNIHIADDENGDHYISLISKTKQHSEVEKLSEMILSMDEK